MSSINACAARSPRTRGVPDTSGNAAASTDRRSARATASRPRRAIRRDTCCATARSAVAPASTTSAANSQWRPVPGRVDEPTAKATAAQASTTARVAAVAARAEARKAACPRVPASSSHAISSAFDAAT
jgi:hypothetical protein